MCVWKWRLTTFHSGKVLSCLGHTKRNQNNERILSHRTSCEDVCSVYRSKVSAESLRFKSTLFKVLKVMEFLLPRKGGHEIVLLLSCTHFALKSATSVIFPDHQESNTNFCCCNQITYTATCAWALYSLWWVPEVPVAKHGPDKKWAHNLITTPLSIVHLSLCASSSTDTGADSRTRSYTEGVDVLWDSPHIPAVCLKHSYFPKMLLTPMTLKMPNHGNTWGLQAAWNYLKAFPPTTKEAQPMPLNPAYTELFALGQKWAAKHEVLWIHLCSLYIQHETSCNEWQTSAQQKIASALKLLSLGYFGACSFILVAHVVRTDESSLAQVLFFPW